MKAQRPAEGILKVSDWGNSKYYQVVCGCGNADDDILFAVEADETGIVVSTYTKQSTDFWTESVPKRYDIKHPWLQEFDWFWKTVWNGLTRKIKLTVQLWIHGRIQYEQHTVMTKQQALNYAETLKTAIKDCEEFEISRNHKQDKQ